MLAAMISQNNPFPGMNPWLEPHWSDVHTRLIAYIIDALSPELPMDLSARVRSPPKWAWARMKNIFPPMAGDMTLVLSVRSF